MGFDASEPSEASTRVINTFINRLQGKGKIESVERPEKTRIGTRDGIFDIELEMSPECEYPFGFFERYIDKQEFFYNGNKYVLKIQEHQTKDEAKLKHEGTLKVLKED